MNPVKRTLARTHKFVSDHKVGVTIVATAAVTTVVLMKVRAADNARLNEFLESEGLLDKFYHSDI